VASLRERAAACERLIPFVSLLAQWIAKALSPGPYSHRLLQERRSNNLGGCYHRAGPVSASDPGTATHWLASAYTLRL
jgi:hypothetical protein